MPHSEIRGSKLIISSPRLIADYHVLHRLLLPRHSPNALLALDLIQKKTGLLCAMNFCKNSCLPSSPHMRLNSDQKSTIPLLPWNPRCRCRSAPRRGLEHVSDPRRSDGLVYLTWTKRPCGHQSRVALGGLTATAMANTMVAQPLMIPHSGHQPF